jgi:uncharacterized protein YndB with AHSA1/START domain
MEPVKGPGIIGLELHRRFRASPEQVFRAWTRPAALREWWCPPGWVAADMKVDLWVGGTLRIAMRRTVDGRTVAVRGQFLAIEQPTRLVFTWRWEGAFAEMPETLVTLELSGTQHDTLLTIRHEHFVDAGARQQHRSGWIAACDRLDRLVTPATDRASTG